MQRCADFVAGLALKQKDPKIAIELVGRKGNHVLPRFIRIMAYTQTGEFDEALNVIEQTMKIPNSGFKPTIGKQMVCNKSIFNFRFEIFDFTYHCGSIFSAG